MTNKIPNKRKSQQRQASIRILLLLGILVCVNLLASKLHVGFDLTEEKRFTLSPSTKKLLGNMDEVAVIDVYLKSDNLPPGFKRLAASTKERLTYFKALAGNKVVFRFSDPFEGKTEEQKGPIFKALAEKGINGTNLQVKDDKGYSEKIIFPAALVQYKGKEYALNLLENDHPGMNPIEVLNYSESLLEYKFASAINFLTQPDQAGIGYIMGNDETLGANTRDALNTIRMLYHLDTIDLHGSMEISGPGLGKYEAIIINKPMTAFEDKDKFKIDQYVMRGGHVLWLVDGVQAGMEMMLDSTGSNMQSFLTRELPLNLDDILFNYGVRINPNLIEDMACNPIPVTVGMLGDQPQVELRKWLYFPILTPSSNHPIVYNIEPVMTTFASGMDTIANPEIKKTVLLASSKYSRVTPHPARVSLSMMAFKPDINLFNKPHQPVAVLLEGKFKSVFNNRLEAGFLKILKDSLGMPFRSQCDSATSMIVVSDGDLLENDFSERQGTMELGYYRFTGQRFGNKTFLLNCLEYLTDRSGLLESRSKDVKLRLLDSGRVKNEKSKWQWINLLLPNAVIILFAIVFMFFRKRKYEQQA